jgi:LmbE family N-acetylglucosaminyl deacetylase
VILSAAALWLAGALRARPAALKLPGLSPRGTVLWVGGHSDDEALVAGALLIRLAREGHPVFVLTVTRGEGTGIRGAEADESVALVRRREFCLACTLYGARDCFSEAFPSRAHSRSNGVGYEESGEEVLAIWRRLSPLDPVEVVRRWIERLAPEWVITLDPDHGMYGHPEHEAAARIALAAARRAGARGPRRVYAAENRFRSLTPGNIDPGPIALEIPADVPCAPRRSCWELQADAAGIYASQDLPELAATPPAEHSTFLRELFSR